MRSVRVTLGAMALTLSPKGPTSCASLRVKAMMPPLAAAYALLLLALIPRPAMDEMFTILPPRWRFITGTRAWMKRKVPWRLKVRSCCQSASESSSTVAAGREMTVLPPTALTRMSTCPCSPTTRSTTASTCTASRASARYAWARPPVAWIAATASLSRPSSLSTAATVPPSAQMMSAVARPMPLAAAVMSATRPSNRMPSSSGRGGRRPLAFPDAHGRLGFEGAQELELLAHLADGGQHLLAEELDARGGVGVAHEAVARPEAHDGRAGLLEEAAELRDHRLRRARDDLLVADLVLEGRGAGVDAPAHRDLHEGFAIRRREVARGRRPHRMGETGELALHPHELPRVGHGLLFRLRHVTTLEIAAVLRARRVARLRRHGIVELPDLLGGGNGGAEGDVGIALARRPDDGLLAEHAGDPHARMRLLQRHRPRVDHAMLVVCALPAEGARLRPRADDQVVRFLETLAVEGGVDAGGELLLAAPAHEARDEAPAGDHVDHGQLLGEPYGVLGEGQRVAEENQLHLLGHRGEDRGEHVALGLHAERRVVVLVQHDAVEAHLLGELVVLDVLVVEAAPRHRIEVLVGEHEGGRPEVLARLRGIRRHRLLGEVHEMHAGLSDPNRAARGPPRLTSRR